MFFVVFVVLLLRLVSLDLEVRLRARRARGLRALYYSVVGQRIPRIAYNTYLYIIIYCVFCIV